MPPPEPRRPGPRIYKPEPGIEKIADILGRLFTARGWGRRQGRLQLENAWTEAITEVMPAYAAHTRAGTLKRGTLEVLVSSGPVLTEIHFVKRRLLEALRKRLTTTPLTNLSFRAGVPE